MPIERQVTNNIEDRDRHVRALINRVRMHVNSLLREIPPGSDANALKQKVVTRLAERGQDIFADHQEKYHELIQGLEDINFENAEEASTEVAKRIASFALQFYSTVEFETLMRVDAAEENDLTIVNEALSYKIVRESDQNQISLHVPTVFTKKPFEMVALFEKGLRALALQLASDPSLRDISKLTGYSWIVYEHPYIVQKMGFSIEEQDSEGHEGLASISREDFMKRYSGTTS